MILKKNRKLGEPVLVIDASHSFVKVGKQNVLQEKDIAKIVDTYVERREEKEYSHLATREEILENQYNMNIPRYVEAIDDDILHDVDGHLFGGIPRKNIDDLKVLQSTVPHVLAKVLKEKCDGYLELVKPVEEISQAILYDECIVAISKEIAEETKDYIDKYWNILQNINSVSNLKQLMDEMLIKIKEVLSAFMHVDVYDGYQIVAEIWKNALTHDTEIISLSGFYSAGRTRESNMVTKGTGDKKREEQDGWVGSIVPNDLIAKRLYSNELEAIEIKKSKVQEIEAELSDLVEAAKVEDSDEANALSDTLNEAGEAFENSKVKAELKKVKKGAVEYELLKKVEKLFTDKSDLNKAIKTDEKALKEAVQERILVLTDEEIDNLMYEKWFGNTVPEMVGLVERPLKSELNTLQILNNRYLDTLSAIDQEIREVESSFEALMNELVVG
jgi:type I restriction enzyme M protein